MDSQSSKPKPKYRMSISLSVLDHLGRGLYSKVPAVLSEVVANAWDADASKVEITINRDEKTIVIADDGLGMTLEDINRRYLNIGYQKRKDKVLAELTPRGRKPMGRKGIGKLSVFAIADTVEVHTVRDGQRNAFRMDYNDIRAQIAADPSSPYYPEELSHTFESNRGTEVKLSGLRKRRATSASVVARNLARRFTVIGSGGFTVSVNGKAISAKDRDYHRFMQFVWHFNHSKESVATIFPNAERLVYQTSTYGSNSEYSISGWIGTVSRQEQINEDTNGIVVFARGKLVHENLLKDMMKGGVWTKYVVGEIDVENLDSDDAEDIITSGRQHLNEDDDRYIALREFLQDGVIRHITTHWLQWRREKGARKALRERPNVKRWYDTLGPDQQKQARSLFGKIEALVGIDEDGKREFYKSTMLAFERLAFHENLSILASLETETDFQRIVDIFSQIEELERAYYHDIVRGRLNVIRTVEGMIDRNEKEKAIQKVIFKHLWLLDPSWERATKNERMEQSVKKEFANVVQSLSQEEQDARIDIRHQMVSGKHVIIELKRPEVSVDVNRLGAQIGKYRNALRKCLEQKYGHESRMPIEIICLTGKRPSLNEDEETVVDLLKARGARYVTYEQMISNARARYHEFFEKEKERSRLVAIRDNFDEDFATGT